MLSTGRAIDRSRSLSSLAAEANPDLLLFASSPYCTNKNVKLEPRSKMLGILPVKHGLSKLGGFGCNDALLPDNVLILLVIREGVVSSQSTQQRELSFKC